MPPRSALAVAITVAVATRPLTVIASAFGNVRQQRKLACALYGTRDLALMATTRAGDPPRADLAPLGDEPTQGGEVLVVDLIDLVAAIGARLTAT